MTTSCALIDESLCDHLLTTTKWNDWVITTAFSSALHFIDEALFPLTFGEDTYPDFEDYYVDRNKHGDFSRNSNQSRIILIYQKLPKALSAYKFLFEAYTTARYNEFKVDADTAKKARLRLAVVKSCCIPKA